MRAWTIPAANLVGKPFSRWACVLAAAVCGALVGPALARAASAPPGLADAQAQIDSALAQVDAVAPGAGAAVQPAVNQALVMATAATAAVPQSQAPAPPPEPAPAAAPPAPPAPTAPPSPAEIVSNAVTPVMTSLGLPPPLPVAVWPRPAPSRTHTPISLATQAPAASAATGSVRVASVTPAAAGAASQAAALTMPQAAAPAGEPSSARRSQRGRASGAAPAGVVLPPRPLPPAPPGPSQDLTAPAQAGGQGQLAPLLVAALAAVLVFARFPFRTRLLPRSAFRRPRRVVLPVWHPG